VIPITADLIGWHRNGRGCKGSAAEARQGAFGPIKSHPFFAVSPAQEIWRAWLVLVLVWMLNGYSQGRHARRSGLII
jgi:hypothetical protein